MYKCFTAHQLRSGRELLRLVSDRIIIRLAGGATTPPLLGGIAGAEAL
jgi:hypothetical protein